MSNENFTFFQRFVIFSKKNTYQKQREQQSTSKTTSSHLIYYICSYNFLHSKQILETNAHLIYYFGTLFTSKCVFLLQRPMNCQPCYWAPNSQIRSTISQRNSLFQKFVIFPKKNTFLKNSARTRAPPKRKRPVSCQPSY